MEKKPDNFFTSEEKEKISQTIKQVELTTSGEIVAMVVDQSDTYEEAAKLSLLGIGIFLGLMIELLIAVYLRIYHHWEDGPLSFWPYWRNFIFQSVQETSLWRFLLLAISLYIIFTIILILDPRLKLKLISTDKMKKRVKEQAIMAFYQNCLYNTRSQTGILIFISILERQVFILGDRGINQKIPPGFWNTLTQELVSGIRQGKAGESICRIIEKCGHELAKHFPYLADDKNELSDNLILK
ncbi:MAG: hypothetical protein HQK51_05390 [Oligoflexia bacterium]|nr:hypothetical protein [Oligoflexia bacterium]